MRDEGVRWDLVATLGLTERLQAVWLIGRYYGGDRSVSWLRLDTLNPATNRGDAWINTASSIKGNTPYFACSERGVWSLDRDPVEPGAGIVILRFPSACLPLSSSERSYRFHNFTSATGNVPDGANMLLEVKDEITREAVFGYRFPSDWCDAGATNCPEPRP